ncbi:MAG TPA: GLPGLI family protein [Mucilaginibacter sp.]|nr:GLPGLI family protein [Mucilaginibacter sp.]
MKKTIITIAALLGLAEIASAQQPHFTTSGTVEYQRRVNVFAMIKKITDNDKDKQDEAVWVPALEAYKKANPQFKTLKSTLSFSDNKTLFTPADADPVTGFMSFAPLMTQNNTIYTDLNEHISTGERKIFDETFLVKDSTRKIKWKITDETRDIAGYTCRRANGLMLDSIYVVAFFTGKIPVPGGPESFNGLPGMILGVALPHENVTWFATKVTDTSLPPNAVGPPKKGKPLDEKGFREKLINALKDQGPIASGLINGFLF